MSIHAIILRGEIFMVSFLWNFVPFPLVHSNDNEAIEIAGYLNRLMSSFEQATMGVYDK
jgi:hypothetical protein